MQTIALPGYTAPSPDESAANDAQSDKSAKAPAYKIPPALWMVFFLVAGYVGMKMILED